LKGNSYIDLHNIVEELFLAQGLFGHLINKADDADAIGRGKFHKNFAIHVT
jgi:hypothetical protein